MKHVSCDQTLAWQNLLKHAKTSPKALNLIDLFEKDNNRFEHLSAQAPHIFADFSKQHLTCEILQDLVSLAHECGLEQKRDAMLKGEAINITENRQVLHTALRGKTGSPYYQTIQQELSNMLDFAEQVRTDNQITDIVNIGIGGSDLGPRMAVQALQPYSLPNKRCHFVSNVDGFELSHILQNLQPENTLFILVSKTFTTQETLANARSAKTWFQTQGGQNIAQHFIAVTTNTQAAHAFGIERIFSFWEWVGGRFSVWSAVGLILAIAIGQAHFRDFLAGAQQMDEHFAHTPLAQNLPVLLGLIDIWNRNFLKRSSRNIAPYHQGLARFPAYLQQLEMESNGKCVTIGGQTVRYETSTTVWGEAGTNGQHAFFQMLHQGCDIIPVEFILIKQTSAPLHPWPQKLLAQLKQQHVTLLMNALAQSRALMIGKSHKQAMEELAHHPQATTLNDEEFAQHRTFTGNRPSTILMLEQLSPTELGALIALHEHRTFVCGAIWGLDSFDQWGVELGKTLAKDLAQCYQSGDTKQLDASTAGLLQHLRS